MRPVCWMGIDPSYSAFAIVRIHADDTYHDQVLDFQPKIVGEGSRRLDMIFRILTEKFETVFTCYDVKAIAIEGYAMQTKFGREIAGELGGMTRVAVVRELRKVPLIVPPTSLKKFVTDSGQATKQDMIDGVEAKWGLRMKTHDRADAYGLAQMAKASMRGASLEYEKKVMEHLSAAGRKITRS